MLFINYNSTYFFIQPSDSTEVKVNKKVSIKNKGSESDDNSEAESGDDAEAEYLMEFEQTKKLQVTVKYCIS